MLRLSTPVAITGTSSKIDFSSRILMLGSCFSDNISSKLAESGFEVCSNPFGTLYNPASILNSAERLVSGTPFSDSDCVMMGAGADLWCSFSHHTSFARSNAEDFLSHANNELTKASLAWKAADHIIITLGTSMVWRRKDNGSIVSNCLKRPGNEFSHEMLSIDAIKEMLSRLVSLAPEKHFMFTVSPIRHLSQGAHINNISKAQLLIAIEQLRLDYFPSFEIMNDELRDYRFYADDLVHPSKMAVEYIWERFTEAAIDPACHEAMARNAKAARLKSHRPLLSNE